MGGVVPAGADGFRVHDRSAGAGLESAGLAGVVFDHGVSGAFAPLGNLILMRDWMASHPAG